MRSPRDVIMDVNAAMNRRDADGMLAHYAPDAVLRDHRAVPFGDFDGQAQLHDLYTGILGLAEEFTERLEFLAMDDERIVADCEVSARLLDDPTGRVVGAEYGYVATIRDGQLVAIELYDDGQAALEASGLDRGGQPSR